jgi:hypothetical protein
MEEQKSTAGQGLGIAGLVLGIMAIPMGIIPCTFYIGIVFGITGIVLSLVAFSQANRAYGPKALIIAALICSILGLTFASLWGFALSRDGARFVKEIIREGIRNENGFRNFGNELDSSFRTMEHDTIDWTQPSSDELKHMTDTLKALEGEQENPE